MSNLTRSQSGKHVVLSGGVGGAKLVKGLTSFLSPTELMIIGNVGDDFEYWGLYISPDLDTLLYTLSNRVNHETGWGRQCETWGVLKEMTELGRDAWFRLGDRDLAVHLERTRRLNTGDQLSTITRDFCSEFGLTHNITPSTDDRLRTIVGTEKYGELGFQDYFVRLQCEPLVHSLRYEGAQSARLHSDLETALQSPALNSLIIAPSNPFLSVAPILAISSFKESLANRNFPCIAISPLVGSKAFKGPTAKIMTELGYEISSFAVASYYSSNLIDAIIIDSTDIDVVSRIEDLGIKVFTTDISMHTLEDKIRLGQHVVSCVESMQKR